MVNASVVGVFVFVRHNSFGQEITKDKLLVILGQNVKLPSFKCRGCSINSLSNADLDVGDVSGKSLKLCLSYSEIVENTDSRFGGLDK